MSWKNHVRNWDGKLYKVLQGNKSCHGGNFDWSLPRGGNPGDWTPIIRDVEMCYEGYHLTTHYAYCADKDNISVYEAEGDVVEFDGFYKVICTRARLLRLVENPFPENNIGKNNSGNYNLGNYNSGNYNSGCYNYGDFNSGNWNFGSYNLGSFNFGNWNSGDYNYGYFCTISESNKIFNKRIPRDWEPEFPEWIYFKLLPEGYFASWQKAFGKANVEGIKELLALPNFDYEVFEKVTSITKRQIEERFNKVSLEPTLIDWKQKYPECVSLLPEAHSISWQKAFEKADVKDIKKLLTFPDFDYEVFEKITSITKEQIKEKFR